MIKKELIKKLNFDLGWLVGEIFYHNNLPTLDVDMIKTRHVIMVSPEEKKENERLEKILNATYTFNGGDGKSKEAHKLWLEHVYELAEKYLPETIDYLGVSLSISDDDAFIDGLRQCLWDTDLSWYWAEDDCIKRFEDGAVRIELTLRIGSLTDKDYK